MNAIVTRLYTGPDGRSHFADIEIPVEKRGSGPMKSEPWKATGVVFQWAEAGSTNERHNAPRRQIIMWIQGRVEIELDDGTKRQFGPGDILMAEDLTGRGHVTRGVGNEPQKSVAVFLD